MLRRERYNFIHIRGKVELQDHGGSHLPFANRGGLMPWILYIDPIVHSWSVIWHEVPLGMFIPQFYNP